MTPGLPAMQDALQSLYRDHHGWLVNWLRKKLSGHAQADDLAQDTFVRILALRENAALNEPRAYLTRVAQRLVIDSYRHAALERAYLEALAHVPADTAPSPEDQMLVMEALREVDRMLEGLSANARMAFMMSRVDGLDHATIAATLGVSAARVSQYLGQALRACYLAVYGT